jgi:hypothetical protein
MKFYKETGLENMENFEVFVYKPESSDELCIGTSYHIFQDKKDTLRRYGDVTAAIMYIRSSGAPKAGYKPVTYGQPWPTKE